MATPSGLNLLMHAECRKSSYSSGSQDCVGVLRTTTTPEVVGLQDTKEHGDSRRRSTLVLSADAFAAFTSSIKS